MFNSFVVLASFCLSTSLAVTYYEHYSTNSTFQTGLTAIGRNFHLNDKEIVIYSGAFHYFRVHPDYWRDTLKKLRAAGLNTVETYMPWNLHNPRIGVFDYGDLGEDMSDFLDVLSFIQMAKEEDLFVILRPGPYICSEWDFGGLPSWLLRDPSMKVRTYYDSFRDYLDQYYASFGPLLKDQLITSNGPIIAVQIENEYGAFGYDDHPRDKLYLEYIQDLFDREGFGDALYFTSDSPLAFYDWGAVDDVLMTANFQTEAEEQLDALLALQPNRPLMVMEFWTGWYDHWVVDEHQTWSVEEFGQTLETILNKSSSVNMYMFIGGTNFGFMAGANKYGGDIDYEPDVSSYDYDAPLTEAGDYTDKYNFVVDTINKYSSLTGIVDHPAMPVERTKNAYGSFPITNSMPFQSLVSQVETTFTMQSGTVNMEALDMNGGSGQSYGYILYQTNQDVDQGIECTLVIRGHVRDMAQVMIGETVITKTLYNETDLNNFGFWPVRDASVNFTSPGGTFTISILVENLGRVNYGDPYFFIQKKGLWEGAILLNDVEITDWEATPLEFKKDFVTSLSGWESYSGSYSTPAAYSALVNIADEPQDTFLDMTLWGKGVVFVNGFNLGRYWSAGPTHTMYIPAPLLVQGDNEFVVFEQYDAQTELVFIDYAIL